MKPGLCKSRLELTDFVPSNESFENMSVMNSLLNSCKTSCMTLKEHENVFAVFLVSYTAVMGTTCNLLDTGTSLYRLFK